MSSYVFNEKEENKNIAITITIGIKKLIFSPKEWWRFAIGRVLDEIHSRNYNFRSAKLLCARLKLLNAYSRAYQCRLKYYLEGKLKT